MTDVQASPVTHQLLGEWRLPQPAGAKRTRGSVLVVGGSPSTPGAAMLAGIAALRVGAGVLGLAVAGSRASSVAAALPEASVTGLQLLDTGGYDVSDLENVLSSYDTLLAGPGLDEPDGAGHILAAVASTDSRLVLDAFVLGALADSAAADRIAGRAVLTPNSTEGRVPAGPRLRRHCRSGRRRRVRGGRPLRVRRVVLGHRGRTGRSALDHPGRSPGPGDVRQRRRPGRVRGRLARARRRPRPGGLLGHLPARVGRGPAGGAGRSVRLLARELADELPLMLVQIEA